MLNEFLNSQTVRELRWSSVKEKYPELTLKSFAVLKGYPGLVSQKIGEHSPMAMRIGLEILQKLMVDLDEIQWLSSKLFSVELSNSTLGISGSNGERTNYFGVVQGLNKTELPIFILFPADEPIAWDTYYKKIALAYEKEMRNGLSTDAPYTLLFLPEKSNVSAWVISFGPLRIISPKAKQLFNFGLGYHPHHEQEHAEQQMNRTDFYYRLLSPLTLYDEAFAILASFQAFRRDYSDFVLSNGGGKPDNINMWMPNVADFNVERRGTPPMKTIPVGNELRRVLDLGGARTVDAMDPMFINSLRGKPSQHLFPGGNEHMYLRQMLDLDLSSVRLKPFGELMSPHFDSAKYPQFMCFALFIEEMIASLGVDLRRQLDVWCRNKTLVTYSEHERLETIIDVLCESLLKKTQLGMYQEISGEHYLLGSKRITYDDLERYCAVHPEVADWDLARKEELLWHFIAGGNMYLSQEERAQIGNILARKLHEKGMIIRDEAERWWLERGLDLVKKRLASAEVINFLELE